MSSNSSSKVTVRFVADLTNLTLGIGKAETAISNMGKSASASLKGLGSVASMVGVAIASVFSVAVVKSTQDAIKYEAIMDNLSSKMGESTQEFARWAETSGKQLGYSKLQSAELANTLSINLSRIATSQKDLTDKTIKLMEAAAIIRSKTGRTMQDVSERIRSAMNQEADGADELGINVRTSAIEQSEAYKMMANGKPWSELSTNMQKAILYHHILEETSRNFGGTLADNTALKVSVFTASLKDLKLQLGQAFLPIVNTVLPYLSAFVSWISKALQYLTLFTQTLFGYKGSGNQTQQDTNAMKGYANSVNSATQAQEKLNKAKDKKAKKGGVASFDEVHTLTKADATKSPKGDSSSNNPSTSVGGGLPVNPNASYSDGLVDKLGDAGKKVVEFAEKVKKFMQPVIELFKKVGGVVKDYLIDTFHSLKEWWERDGASIGQAFQALWDNFLYPIFSFIVEYIWDDVKGAIDGLIDFFTGLLSFIGDVFMGNWDKAWKDLWKCVKGAFEAIWNIVDLIFIKNIGGAIKAGLKGFFGFFKNFGDDIVRVFDDVIKFLVGFFKNGWNGIIKTTKGIWDNLVSWFAKLGGRLVKPIKDAWKGIGSWFSNSVVKPITTTVGGLPTKFKTIAKDAWNAIKGGFTNVSKWFTDNIVTKAYNGVKSLPSKLKSIGSNAWSSLKGAFGSVSSWFKTNVVDKASSTVNGIVNKFKDIGKNAWAKIKEPFTSAADWFKKNVVDNISNVFKGIKLSFDSVIFNKVQDFYNNKMRKPINNVLSKIEGALDWLPGDIKLPRLPQLYNGGITNGKMLAQIGDNVGGREVVSPLDTLNSIIANTMLQTLKFNNIGGGNQGGGDIVLNIDGRQFARIIQPYQNMESKRTGGNLVLKSI